MSFKFLCNRCLKAIDGEPVLYNGLFFHLRCYLLEKENDEGIFVSRILYINDWCRNKEGVCQKMSLVRSSASVAG